MIESATKKDSGASRLVLGFDAGCARCRALAAKIEELAGERLEVRSLHHPQVELWREQALGEDAPWLPTLFEVGGVRGVRAWTGARMAAKLARTLGPVSTWRVMQALGEIDAPRTVADRTLAGGISRGQFLKGVGGAALAFGVLSGSASPAMALDEGDEESLAYSLSVIEDIPQSVIDRGHDAVQRWVQREAQERLNARFNLLGCGYAVLNALVNNALPIFKILKIRRAIKAFGGVWKFVREIYAFYRTARRNGASRWGAVKVAAARADDIAGGGVYDALLDLFSLTPVFNNCF